MRGYTCGRIIKTVFTDAILSPFGMHLSKYTCTSIILDDPYSV